RLDDVMVHLGERWSSDWLPTIQSHLRHWRSIDLGSLTPPALLAHLEDTLAWGQQVWAIHFQLIFPVLLAISRFEEYYHDLFPDADQFGAFRLLQGFDNKTLEADRALWQLSRRALVAPEVREALATNAARQLPGALQRSATGRCEEHVFWIDDAIVAERRRVFVVYGRRLAEDGRIDVPGDGFYLALADVREHAVAPPGADRRALVMRGRAELEHFRTITPP